MPLKTGSIIDNRYEPTKKHAKNFPYIRKRLISDLKSRQNLSKHCCDII